MDSGIILTIPTQATLVQFDEPVVVRGVDDTPTAVEIPVLDAQIDAEVNEMMALRLSPECPTSGTFESYAQEEILTALIPSVEWIQERKMFRQPVSTEHADRDDVLNLGLTLNQKLKERQASPVGVCPIRRQLYTQVFDELIRQSAILCPARGLLLNRMRDELGLTLDSYASIYETCKSFESRYTKEPQNSKEDLVMLAKKSVSYGTLPNEVESMMEEIESKKRVLLHRIRHLEDGIHLKELKYQERMDAAEALFQEEVQHLTKVKAQLEKQLELFKGPNPHDEVKEESILDRFLNKQREKEAEKKSTQKA